ncbi:hypothetical protein ACFX1R_005175 [Malus domestica]
MPSSTPVDHCLRQMPHQEIDLLKIVKRFFWIRNRTVGSGCSYRSLIACPMCSRTGSIAPGRLRSGNPVPRLRLPLPGRVPGEMQPGPVRRGGHCQVWIAVPVQTGSRVEAEAHSVR